MAKALESITLVENGIDITALTNPNFPPSNIFLMRISKAIGFFISKMPDAPNRIGHFSRNLSLILVDCLSRQSHQNFLPTK